VLVNTEERKEGVGGEIRSGVKERPRSPRILLQQEKKERRVLSRHQHRTAGGGGGGGKGAGMYESRERRGGPGG